MKKKNNNKKVEALTHDEARRKNIPTAEFQSIVQKESQDPLKVNYPRSAAGLDEEKTNRNRDLDPQLVWRGKDEQDWSEFMIRNILIFFMYFTVSAKEVVIRYLTHFYVVNSPKFQFGGCKKKK